MTETMIDSQQTQAIPAAKRRRKRTDLSHPNVIADVVTRKSLQHSNLQIAKDLQMDQHSVAKVLDNANYNEIAKTYGERANELIPKAFQAIEHRLEVKKDGELGRKYLVDMGVIGESARKDTGIQVQSVLHQQIINLIQPSTLHNNAAQASTNEPSQNTQVIDTEPVKLSSVVNT